LNYFDDQVETPLWRLIKPLAAALRRGSWFAVITVIALIATFLGSASPVNASTPSPVTVDSGAIFEVETVTPATILRAGGSPIVLNGFGLDLVEEITFDGNEIVDSVPTGTTIVSFESLPVTSTESVVSLELAGNGYSTSIELTVTDGEENSVEPIESTEPIESGESGEADESLGFIVKYKELESLPGAISRAEIATGGAADLSLGSDLGVGMRRIEVQNAIDSESADEVLRALESDPRIEWAEPVRRTRGLATFPSIPPNDADYDAQWSLWDSYGIGLGTGTASVSPGWDLSLGQSMVVAVIDTGITDHEDLPSSQLVAGYDFVNDNETAVRNNAYGGLSSAEVNFDGDYINPSLYGAIGWDDNPLDPGDWGDPDYLPSSASSTWHGTRVAGLIGAKTNNLVGIAGVAPEVAIQSVRALSWLGGTDADLAAAITWASGGTVAGTTANATPANVINMSLGGVGSCDSALQLAVDGAISRGVVLIAAAGNSAQDASGFFPANCAGVVAAGATTSLGKRASYSNYGSTVDLSAPGTAVSTTNLGTYTPTSTTTGIASASGTSFAAPIVAGVAALLKSMDSGLTPGEIEQLLTTFVRPFAGGVCDADSSKTCGSGILDASLATVALDNSLSTLGVSGVSLSPSFNRVGTSYAASVDNNVSQALITPTQSMAGGSLTVDGSSATSGVAATVDLAVGSNLVDIVSTGPGGYGSVTYSVTITRADVTPTPPSPPAPAPGPAPAPDSGSGGGSSPGGENAVAGLAVTSFAPISGTTAGGTLVTVSGSGFTGASQVLFGAAAAQIVAVVSDTTIQVLSPPGRAGTYTVTVVGSSGARVSSVGVYTYVTVNPEPEDRIRVVNSVGGVERVVVVAGESPYRPTVVLKKRKSASGSGRSVATAPRVKVDIGVVVTPRVKGLPKSTRFGVSMLVPGADTGTQRMFMGTVRTNANGVAILPASRATEAGAYTYRLIRKGTVRYYVQMRVTK
jgi:serine protease